jgi:hypothetical protein
MLLSKSRCVVTIRREDFGIVWLFFTELQVSRAYLNIMPFDNTSVTPAYVVQIRWLLEGILVPSVGTVGILGMHSYSLLHGI